MQVQSKGFLDRLTDSDSDSDVEKVFVGTPKQSEAKFREVVNLLQTVKPVSKAPSAPSDYLRRVPLQTTSPSPCPAGGDIEVINSTYSTSQTTGQGTPTQITQVDPSIAPVHAAFESHGSRITLYPSPSSFIASKETPTTVASLIEPVNHSRTAEDTTPTPATPLPAAEKSNEKHRGLEGPAAQIPRTETPTLKPKTGYFGAVITSAPTSGPSRPCNGDQDVSERVRKRARRSPERLIEDKRKHRLLSLSPDSSTVLTGLFTPTTTRNSKLAVDRPTGNLFAIPSHQAQSSPHSGENLSNITFSIGPSSPAARVPISPDKAIFYANPLDNPNRSPARRVLVSIASTTPSRIIKPRGESCEPPTTSKQVGINLFARSRSAEPAPTNSLPHPLVPALTPVPEETSKPLSTLRIGSKIPRPPSKPYTRPPGLCPPADKSPTKVQSARTLPEDRTSPCLIHPANDNASAITQPKMARLVTPGMFSKNKSEVNSNPLPEISPPEGRKSPAGHAISFLSSALEAQTTEATSASVRPITLDVEDMIEVSEDRSPRATTRARRVKALSKEDACFADIPKSLRRADSRQSARKHSSKRRPQTTSGFGITDNALRALTGSNTLKNQKYAIELDERVIHRKGKRPQSPNTRARTEMERREEAREKERQARAERRQRRSGEVPSSPQNSSDLEDDGPSATQGRHQRGPGEDEDYHTPQHDSTGRVKWNRRLFFSHPAGEGGSEGSDERILKGILSGSSKGIQLDSFGNHPESGLPVPGVVTEKVIFTRYVYEDDPEAIEEAQPDEKPKQRGGRRKKG